MVEASANHLLSSQLKSNPWRQIQPSSDHSRRRRLKLGVGSWFLVLSHVLTDGETHWKLRCMERPREPHPRRLVQELSSSGSSWELSKVMASRRLEERRGLWAGDARWWSWTEGEGGGWRPRLPDPTKSWTFHPLVIQGPTWFLGCKRFYKLKILSLWWWDLAVCCDVLWKPEDKMIWIFPRMLKELWFGDCEWKCLAPVHNGACCDCLNLLACIYGIRLKAVAFSLEVALHWSIRFMSKCWVKELLKMA